MNLEVGVQPADDTRPGPWVLVTGGTRGIGRGLVDRMAELGYGVAFTYHQSHALADEIVQQHRACGRQVTAHACDAASAEDIDRVAAVIRETRGVPYALFNNVGITRDALLMQMPAEDWSLVMRSNLDSVFHLTRHFVSDMIQQGDGCIVQMSSVSGLKGMSGQTNYAATKAALVGLTRSLAVELARFKIRVNAILPGFIDTEMVAAMPEAKRRAIEKMVPLKRMGTVTEVADLAAFLISPRASYLTGQAFVIDGGLTT